MPKLDGEAGTLGARSAVKRTSSASKAEPSVNFTPLRSLNSQVVSLIAFHEVARPGVRRCFASCSIRREKMCVAIELFGPRL